MKTYLECIPCFSRQALDSVRLLSNDETIHERVLRKVLREASEMDFSESPPAMGQRIHRLIRHLLGDDDPYRTIKEHWNRFALNLYPELKKRVEQSSNPLETAVRLAIAGNIIDFGVNSRMDDSLVHDTIENCMKSSLWPHTIDEFQHAVNHANTILYLGDNAGEIVFDRALIEHMHHEKLTFVVRGYPIINDVTIYDAQVTGITDIVKVIENGSDAPGTILEYCSSSFQQQFEDADLVIAKGQGNFETLSNVKKNIIFLLMAKCPVIAKHLECEVGSLVLKLTTDIYRETK